jgi:hypothetical protein
MTASSETQLTLLAENCHSSRRIKRNEDVSDLRRKHDSAYRQHPKPAAVLPRMLWPGVPDFHGALCADP